MLFHCSKMRCLDSSIGQSKTRNIIESLATSLQPIGHCKRRRRPSIRFRIIITSPSIMACRAHCKPNSPHSHCTMHRIRPLCSCRNTHKTARFRLIRRIPAIRLTLISRRTPRTQPIPHRRIRSSYRIRCRPLTSISSNSRSIATRSVITATSHCRRSGCTWTIATPIK